MCVLPKAPKAPVIPERQAVQVPTEPQDSRGGLNARRRRGMWASIFTSPRGVAGGAPTVTGMSGTTG